MAERSRQPHGSHLILYDGICGLCNRMNAFVLKHDAGGAFHFASLQSSLGRSLLRQHNRNPDDLDTFYVFPNYRTGSAEPIERARAGLFVLSTLGFPWSWAGVFAFLPDRLLNLGYNVIARNRYRIFGKYDQCLLPTADHQERFIDI